MTTSVQDKKELRNQLKQELKAVIDRTVIDLQIIEKFYRGEITLDEWRKQTSDNYKKDENYEDIKDWIYSQTPDISYKESSNSTLTALACIDNLIPEYYFEDGMLCDEDYDELEQYYNEKVLPYWYKLKEL